MAARHQHTDIGQGIGDGHVRDLALGQRAHQLHHLVAVQRLVGLEQHHLDQFLGPLAHGHDPQLAIGPGRGLRLVAAGRLPQQWPERGMAFFQQVADLFLGLVEQAVFVAELEQQAARLLHAMLPMGQRERHQDRLAFVLDGVDLPLGQRPQQLFKPGLLGVVLVKPGVALVQLRQRQQRLVRADQGAQAAQQVGAGG